VPYKDPEDGKRWREARKTGKAYIYWLLEPETHKVRYVGSTLDVQDRMRLHWDHRNKRNTKLAEWLRSLDEMPEHEIIQEVSKEFQYKAEEYWTRLLGQVSSVELLNERKEDGTYSPPLNFKRGEESPTAKLTEDKVRKIKRSSESLRVLAVKYDVSWITIRNIRIGKTWKHIT
jgi:hypothetical protein